MAKYVIETFPQDEYTFRMYHNTGKKTWQKIQEETGCYAIINTAYFSMSSFAVDSNTMIAGKWLFGPTYHEYGLCVDLAGRLTVGTEKEAVYDYTVGLPPCYISGKQYSTTEHGRNGASFVGVARNGDVTCLIADKSNGMTTAQCCRELLDAGCVDIFRFDGSWSSQGTLGPDKDLDPAVERKVAVYLLIFKKGTTAEKKETLSNGIEIKTNLANKKNYGSSRSTSAIKYIVLHYTANDGDTDESNGKYFANTVTQTSAHYFVDSDSVTRSVPDNYVAWSVGGAKYADCAKTGGGTLYGKCTNSNSLSIELCDDVKNGTIKPNQKTIDNAIVLCKHLMKKYGVAPENVVRHFEVNGKHCLPCDNTELLTKDGWISLADVQIGDHVAQYHTYSDTITFGPVLDKVTPREDVVYTLRGIEATKDHRMWLQPSGINSPQFRDVTFGYLMGEGRKQYIVKNGANYVGSGLNELTDDELRFLAWIQGDGHYMKHQDGSRYGLEFHLKKPRKITRICQLMDTLGVTYTVCNKSDGSVSLRHYNMDVVEWAERFLDNKRFTYKLLEMSREQFEIFWAELLIIDGNTTKNLYTSVVRQNLDVIQALCATKGVRTSLQKLGAQRYVAVQRVGANYSVYKYGETPSRKTSVSCVTVPSGYILIRQRAKTFIVGNCPKFWMDDDTWHKEFWTKIGGVVAEEELNDIEWVQAELNERYDARLTVDGSWGPASKKAMVKAVQTELNLLYKAGLVVDGSFGPASQAKFPDIKSVTKSNLAWLIQACLVINGYDIECDGSYGPGTAAIIKEFQKKNGLTVDGICGKNTMLKLLG